MKVPQLNQHPDSLGRRILDTLWRDSKYALRRLARDWQFSAAAIAILALGIGANTAVFSILNNTLFLPHPFTDSQRLVNIYQNEAKTGDPEGVSHPALRELQQQTAVFISVGAAKMTESRYQTVDPRGATGALRFGLAEYATANYLEVLGLRPSLGRWFTAAEEHSAEPVAVLGWPTWQRDFAADPNVLGQTLNVGGTRIRIIGVGPASLNSSASNTLVSALWLPVSRIDGQRGAASGTPRVLENRDDLSLQVRARLRPGVTIPQAQAAMNITARRLATDYPDAGPKRGITVLPTDSVRVHPREYRLKPFFITVLSVVGLVLAIACSNLATLLLVRSTARSAEISVRLALGATRLQLVRHLLMDSLVLSLAGAVAGIALARWGLLYLATVDLPLIVSMKLDYRVLGFAILAAAFCGVGFGLTPALRATRQNVAGALREEKGSSGAALSLARGWFTLKNSLIVGQVAATFLLLVCAVLAMSILSAAQSRSLGYRPSGLAMIETDPRYAGYDLPRARAVFEDLRRRIAVLPGVQSVFITTGWPGDGQFDREFRLDGASETETFKAEGAWSGPGYFQTLGIPVLFGRAFDERDSPQSPEALVVSEAFARQIFGTNNAVGKRLRFSEVNTRPMEIVGVVGNTRNIQMVLDAPQKFVYRSAAQAEVMPNAIVARVSQNDSGLLRVLQQELRRLHPELPVIAAKTMDQQNETELVPFRIAFLSLGALGALGLLLAGVGLYAVVAYAVAQRSRELGIRIALGARPAGVTRLVVRDVTALVVTGIAIGSACSWAGLAMLQSGVASIIGVNLWAVARVALVIVVCGVAAAWVPTRRAVRTDPMSAIRHS